MREILKAFFARVPNIGALRLAYMICAMVPFFWLQDESTYTVHHEIIRTTLSEDLSWYKFQEVDGMSTPWCILSLTDVSPQNATTIAKKIDMISSTGVMTAQGNTKMSLSDRVGCEGVDDRNIFWLGFAKTHSALRQDYITFNISIWLTRLFYLYLMGVAIGNIINRRYAVNGAELLREQTLTYLDYKNSVKKNLKKSKKKAGRIKTKIKKQVK